MKLVDFYPHRSAMPMKQNFSTWLHARYKHLVLNRVALIPRLSFHRLVPVLLRSMGDWAVASTILFYEAMVLI